jgi:hypothetical protein
MPPTSATPYISINVAPINNWSSRLAFGAPLYFCPKRAVLLSPQLKPIAEIDPLIRAAQRKVEGAINAYRNRNTAAATSPAAAG